MARYPIFQFHEGNPDPRPADAGAPGRLSRPRPEGEDAKARSEELPAGMAGRMGRVFQIPW